MKQITWVLEPWQIMDLQALEIAQLRQWDREAGITTRTVDHGYYSEIGTRDGIKREWVPIPREVPIE